MSKINRWSDYMISDKQRKLLDSCTDMSQAEKIIYQWVKQDHISPKQMGELLIECHKRFA
jgi:5-bromo-4-chloroindolyl phosphate hydrolysis protein